MKKLMLFLLIIAVFTFCGAAMAQVDILGGHNVNGHGCAACHTPHNGAAGNGGASADADTGNAYLWGRTFVNATYSHMNHGATTAETFTVNKANALTNETLFHTAACLSCHDGAIHPVGMTGTSLETVDGTNTAPTYIGTGDVAGANLQNDHPVHVPYLPNPAPAKCTNPAPPAPPICSAYNWPSTLSAGALTFTAGVPSGAVADVNAAFAASYGRPARFYADAATNEAMVECSTCHNPHAVDVAKGTFAGTANAVKPARFFMRGWYDSVNPASNSATQFCRSCHYSKSNENYGRTVPTT